MCKIKGGQKHENYVYTLNRYKISIITLIIQILFV